jgi:hypothetical protein
MCSCEPGWLCVRCAGTRSDPAYMLELHLDSDTQTDWGESLPVSPAEYEVSGEGRG